MNLLVDTHVVLWFKLADPRLSASAKAAMTDPDNALYLSAASAAEIGIKFALGKLKLPHRPPQWVPQVMSELGMRPLSIDLAHAWSLADLPRHHDDPFDRLLIAQAVVEDMPVLTADARFRSYAVKVLW